MTCDSKALSTEQMNILYMKELNPFLSDSDHHFKNNFAYFLGKKKMFLKTHCFLRPVLKNYIVTDHRFELI